MQETYTETKNRSGGKKEETVQSRFNLGNRKKIISEMKIK